jgi:precorrin-6B methylase 2
MRLFLRFIRQLIKCTRVFIKDICLTFKEHHYDKRLGIKTVGIYREKEDKSINNDEFDYWPCDYTAVKIMMDHLKLDAEEVFVDLGCGVGRVVFLVATAKLKKVIGIELRKTIADIARDNLHTVKLKNTPVEIVHGDAAVADVKEGTVFFMYNPFGPRTLISVLDHIHSSLNDNPRKIRIVYNNRAYAYLLDSTGWLSQEGEIAKTGFTVWTNTKVSK